MPAVVPAIRLETVVVLRGIRPGRRDRRSGLRAIRSCLQATRSLRPKIRSIREIHPTLRSIRWYRSTIRSIPVTPAIPAIPAILAIRAVREVPAASSRYRFPSPRRRP
jgi:hypothetical protein